MTPKEFVELFHNEKTDYFNNCFDETADLYVSGRIKDLNLSDEQKEIMKKVVDGILTDVFYTILLGIDGSASIGGFQYGYKLYDEDGNLLTDCGEIEGFASEYFQPPI